MKKNKTCVIVGAFVPEADRELEDSCSDLDCLNTLVFALKIEMNTVRNFMAQEKRVRSKRNLMSK